MRETKARCASAFVQIIQNSGGAHDHNHDDDKARMLWLKENKTRLGAVCKGFLSVVPDQERFGVVEKQTASLRTALGIHFVEANSLESADALAADVLAPNT